MASRKKQAENDEIFMGFTAPHTGKDKKTIPSHIKTVTFESDKKQMKTFERKINHFNKRFYDLYSSSYGGENDKYDVAAGAKYTKGYLESLSSFCDNTPLDKFRECIGEKLTAVVCAKDAVKYGVPSRIIDFMQPVIKHMPENIQSKAMEIEAKGRIPLNEESAAMTKLAFDAKYYNELRDPKKRVGAKERYQEAIENLRCAMVADEVDFSKASAVMCEQMTTYMKNDKNGVMQRRYGGFLSGKMLISESKSGIKFVEPDPNNENKFKEVDLFRNDLVREPAGNMKDLFELHKNGMKQMFDAAGYTRSDSISLGKGKNLKAMCKQTYAMYKDDLAIIKQDSENKKINVSEFKKQFKAYTGSLIYDYLKDGVKVNDKLIPSFIRKCKKTYDSKYKDIFEKTDKENIPENIDKIEESGISLSKNKRKNKRPDLVNDADKSDILTDEGVADTTSTDDKAAVEQEEIRPTNKEKAQKGQMDQSSDKIEVQPEDTKTNVDIYDSSDVEESAQAEFITGQTEPAELKVENQNSQESNIEPVKQQPQSEVVEITNFEPNTIGGPTSRMKALIGEQSKQDIEKTDQSVVLNETDIKEDEKPISDEYSSITSDDIEFAALSEIDESYLYDAPEYFHDEYDEDQQRQAFELQLEDIETNYDASDYLQMTSESVEITTDEMLDNKGVVGILTPRMMAMVGSDNKQEQAEQVSEKAEQTQSEVVETTNFKPDTIGGPTSRMKALVGEQKQAEQVSEKTEQIAEINEQAENRKSIMSSLGNAVADISIKTGSKNAEVVSENETVRKQTETETMSQLSEAVNNISDGKSESNHLSAENITDAAIVRLAEAKAKLEEFQDSVDEALVRMNNVAQSAKQAVSEGYEKISSKIGASEGYKKISSKISAMYNAAEDIGKNGNRGHSDKAVSPNYGY